MGKKATEQDLNDVEHYSLVRNMQERLRMVRMGKNAPPVKTDEDEKAAMFATILFRDNLPKENLAQFLVSIIKLADPT